MSTRSTIKHDFDPGRHQGFHLYRDLVIDGVVHLELVGVTFEAGFDGDAGSVTVAIPDAWARKLGLIPITPDEEDAAA